MFRYSRSFGFLAFVLLAASFFGNSAAAAVNDARSPKVIELYTSQGCAACPIADALVGELAAERSDVLLLTFNVDYWDFMGWKDTLAELGNARRQREYSERFEMQYLYTPQVVVQGTFQATGSDRGAINDNLKKADNIQDVAVSLVKQGDVLTVKLQETALKEDVRLIVAAFDKKHTIVVEAGDNKGKTLTYHNVVRKMTSFGMWHGETMSMSVPWDPATADSCVVLLQSVSTGRILGAAEMPW